MRDDRRAAFFIRNSVNLLLGTAYSSNHFHANCSKVWSGGISSDLCAILSPRANFCRSVASYASAPARELSGLRILYLAWCALKSTHHEFFIFRTAITLLVDWLDPVVLQIRQNIRFQKANAAAHFEEWNAAAL